MKIKSEIVNFGIVRDINKANLITHGGLFHADEVMATAILIMYNTLYDKKGLSLYRAKSTAELKDAPSDAIIYDIGFGVYDHHQCDHRTRPNGIPYASAGLIWRSFGPAICSKIGALESEFDRIDHIIIQGIDARDNGVLNNRDIAEYTISSILFSFNPIFEDIEDENLRFTNAVRMAFMILSNILYHSMKRNKSRSYIFDQINDTTNIIHINTKSHILVLDKYVAWKETALDLIIDNDIKIIIYPSRRKGYQWQLVPKTPNTFETFVECPENLRGLRDEECQIAFDVTDAIFTHNTGFCGAAESLDGCINMAMKILS